MSEAAQSPFSPRRLAPLVMLGGAAVLFFALGGHRYLNFRALADNHDWLCGMVEKGGLLADLGFIVAYAGLVALSVPGAAIFTITSGFLFGAWLGAALSVTGATLGAVAVFLAARAGLGGLLARAGPRVRRLEAGFHRDALNYLLILRLIPIFPFWLINIAAGATGMRLSLFVVGTFFGIIPTSFVYASLGSGLGELANAGGEPGLSTVLRPEILLPVLGLAGLALLPVFYRRWRGGRVAGHPSKPENVAP
jgi:uncharacterized membrane protein YdjX (TVP38/TMEM64 family)